ncbi:unnamed protein product [Sphagnum troendelagicum]
MIMELMDGNLEDLIKDCLQKNGSSNSGPFSQEVTLDILYQIARGMQYLHHQGLGHGRLKCSNVLVRTHNSDSIEVKVADFGYATKVCKGALERTFSERGAVGTGFWRAPEVLSAMRNGITQPTYTSKADVYSYGMTCYEVLTGLIPFDGHPPSDYSLVLSGNRPRLPKYVSDDVAELITRCWHQEPEQRPEFLEICHKLRSLMKAT